MRVNVSSSLVSGAYTCFELLISIVLSRSLVIILECWNAKNVFVDKRKIQLWSSRLALFTNHGLTTRHAHGVALFIFTTVIFLTTIGGFAITGVTGKHTEDVQVRHLVRKATPGHVFNFTKHLSFEDGLVSGTVLLFKDYTTCVKGIGGKEGWTTFQFSSDIDDEELSSLNRRMDEWLFNSTCLTTESNFTDRVLSHHEPLQISVEENACNYRFKEELVPFRTLTRMRVNLSEGCPFEMLETWCFMNFDVFCSSSLRIQNHFTFALLHSGSAFPGLSVLKEPMESDSLKSMALLSAMGGLRESSVLQGMATLTIEKNAYVERIIGDRDVTEINRPLLFTALGSALVLTVSTVFVALALWVKLILLPGRRGYNCLNSAMDLLSCAAAIASESDEDGILRKKNILFGVNRKEPHVGPLQEPADGDGCYFHESELI